MRLDRSRDVPPRDRPAALRRRAELGQTYAMGFARTTGSGYELVHIFYHAGQPVAPEALCTPLGADEGGIPSAVAALPAVHWDEREIRDLYGVRFTGHPDDRRLVLPDDHTAAVLAPGRPVAPWHPRLFAHREAVHVPVGPVHAGIIESGQFHFSIMGETVLQMDARLFWNHRGIETALEGRRLDEAFPVIDRICGCCTVSHQAALAHAVESLAGVTPPPRVEAVRLLLLELERLANHLHDLAQLAAGAALQVLLQQGLGLRERLLSVQQRHFGRRYLFGTIRPGTGVPVANPDALMQAIGGIYDDAAAWMRRLFAHQGFRDRLTGIGRVDAQQVTTLGGVGLVARASGLDRDLRRELPYGFYRELATDPVGRTAGDAMARAEVRQLEVEQAWSLIRRVLGALPSLPDGAVDLPQPLEGASLGYCESPRGATFHYLHMHAGRITRYHVRSASFANWPLIMVAAADNPIGDFPLINKSFELCYACCDR